MEKKFYEVGYSFYYTELVTVRRNVHSTDEQAKKFILEKLLTEPFWIQSQVSLNFESTDRTKVFINDLIIHEL